MWSFIIGLNLISDLFPSTFWSAYYQIKLSFIDLNPLQYTKAVCKDFDYLFAYHLFNLIFVTRFGKTCLNALKKLLRYS